MPLSGTEREITKAVVDRFLNEGTASPRGLLVRRFKNLQALERLNRWPVLKKVGTGDEAYLPLALAFHYSGDADTVLRARTSVEIVLRILQNLFEVEVEKRDFGPVDVEVQAGKMFDRPPANSVIKLGLYLAQEFGVFAGWSSNSEQTELHTFRIAERIIELTNFERAWGDYIENKTPYIENPEKFDGSLEPRIPVDLPDIGTIAALAAGAPLSSTVKKDAARGGNAKLFASPFDDYEVVRQVGCGGSGTVFEVKDSAGGHWALKAMDGAKAPRKKLKRFQNEIQFCYRASSKYIVRVLDFGRSEDGSLFYVMPLYPGTLRGRMSAGIKKNEVLPLSS
jgi:hypothetical protein